MERTINSLTYKGSIPDAINQSRREKKLFVVYISGDDEASSSLEQSTLVDADVVEVIGRCCIFLHLKQGNVDASQFSAIYPQKSVPSISVIGLNGVMLWNHEGRISSENLKECIQKSWAAIHLEDIASTLLTASLASRSAESVNTTSTSLPTQQGSSTSENLSASSRQSPAISGAGGVAHSTDMSQLPSGITHDEPLELNKKEGSESISDLGGRTVQKLDSACTEGKCDLPDSSKSSDIDGSTEPKEKGTPSPKKNKVDESSTRVPSVVTPSTDTTREGYSQLLVEQDKATTSSAPDEPVSNSVESDDIHLSIRIPNGNRLEIKLTKQDVLRKVKNFVDENQGSGVGSYDLSMIYPKRVFTEQDMEATLSELGIQNRHALIVVPHRQSAPISRPQSSLGSYDVGANSSGGGYFSYFRTVLSYANPLFFLRGSPNSSNPELQSNEGPQHHRPSSAHWNRPGTETAPQRQPLPGNRSQEATHESPPNTLRRQSRPFGGNVHTLGSEDQGPSDDRNLFWNGNSTEFGGADKK